MLFNKEEDWKEYLPDDDKSVLSELFNLVKRNRGAYLNADDVKVAQLWTALIELRKETNSLREVLERLEEPFKAIVGLGDVQKRKAIDKIVSDIIKPVDPESREAATKVVDSLMRM